MTIWGKQQTIETFRAHQDLVEVLNRNVDADAGIAAYRAEKLANRKQHDAHVLDYDNR